MVCEEKERTEMPAIAPTETLEVIPEMEARVEVASIRKQNEAVAYLRKQDCKMLATLKRLLGEDIRLNGILDGINAEIAGLNEVLKTRKPRFKLLLFIIGLAIGAGLYMILDTPLVLLVGLGISAIAVIKKIVGNKKWKALMEATNAALREKEEEAARAKQEIEDHWNNQVAPFITLITQERFPSAYARNYEAVCCMLHIMENMMADTIKEATNLYEEMAFRARMNAAFQNMEISMRDTARSAARSAEAAERSAAANESAAASAAITAASSVSMAKSAEKSAKAAQTAAKVVERSTQ